MNTDLSPREIAIHEAGHAVAGYLLDEPFVHITTESVGRARGLTLPGHVAFDSAGYAVNEVSTPEECRRIERWVMISVAGEYTQRLLYKRSGSTPPNDHTLAKHAQYDNVQVMRYATSLTRYGGWPPDMDSVTATLRQRLHERLSDEGERYWTLVERLADTVMGGKTLTWDEAIAVLQSA